MWPNFQNHHGRIFPAQRTARGICPQHVDGLGVKTDEMRVVQSHSHMGLRVDVTCRVAYWAVAMSFKDPWAPSIHSRGPGAAWKISR